MKILLPVIIIIGFLAIVEHLRSKLKHTKEQIAAKNEITESDFYKIDAAFKNNEFKLYLQFITDSKTKELVSAEALSRWESPGEGIVFPGKYIGLLEKNGLIVKFDYYMFDKVCAQLEKWKGTEKENLSLSCNFTRITISETDFVDVLSNIASGYDFDHEKLIIEITEDAIEKNSVFAVKNIAMCKEMGFKIALDDMGSGNTSLINLCEYPLDTVKIDREILLKTDKEKGKALFEGMVALVHKLGLKVVCEGVETEEQNEFVTNTKCDFIQGWYYSRVYSEPDSEKFFAEYCK